MSLRKRLIEDAIWSRDDLSCTDKLVALAVLRHLNERTGLCCPSQERLSSMTGLTDRAIRNAVARLREQGILTTSTKGRSLHYDFNAGVILRVSGNVVPVRSERRSGIRGGKRRYPTGKQDYPDGTSETVYDDVLP